MTQSIQQFGASIKKQYPQYKDMSDEDVGLRVIAKYPQYQNSISLAVNTDTIPKPKSFFDKVSGVAQGISNFVGAKGITEQFGASLAKANIPGATALGIPKLNQEEKGFVQEPGLKKVVGSAIQTGANLIPGAAMGAGLATKVGVGAATGYAFDVGNKLQNDNENPLTPGVGTTVGAGLPVAGAVIKPAAAIIGRLLKGLGSGLSGVSTKTIDTIINNPEMAQKATERLAKNGNSKILEENAKTIVGGVSKIRQQARKSFGEGLEKLSETDINPKTFRDSIQPTLDKFGVEGGKNARKLSNVEFDQPKNLQKASELINKISNAKLDGKSLRKLSDDIENAAYKTTGSDAERLSFNAFVNDLANSVKSAVSASTDKLGEINKKFSQDMQLTEAVQNIFGKINYKNLPEVVKASQKLETLFSQKGLAPDVVDDFFKRIGISSNEFRASEAVRQMTNKEPMPPNTPGFNLGEITRTITGSIITPEMVKNLSVATGLGKEKLIPFLKVMKPSARNILINALLQGQANSGQNQ